MGKTENAIGLGSIIHSLLVMFESPGVANEMFSADLNLRYILLKLMNEINLASVCYRRQVGDPLIARHHLREMAMVSDEH